MARDLSSVLGGSKGGEGYMSFNLGYISWARGHLLEMVPPAGYNPAWKSWVWETLPMIPPDFNFLREPKDDCVSQLSILKKLYKEVDIVVNACDAGREGELIWWEILRYCGWGDQKPIPALGSKPALRLWAQSNTSAGLREAWEKMFPIEDKLGLAEGAYARSEADWLLGLNLTRASTLSFSPPQSSKDRKAFWSIGRVQTPILALIVDRDNHISNFVPKTFYQIKATFQGKDPFEALVLVPSGIKAFEEEGEEGKPEKQSKSFLNEADAAAVLSRVLDSRSELWDVSEVVKSSLENPPNLFSLTSLQKWCNKVWGWEAKRTLDAAQAAYESDKTLSYPRTDASFLPKDSMEKMDAVYQEILSKFFVPEGCKLPAWVLPPSSSSRASYIFDDSKLTDHYAIVPTGVIPSNLSSDAGKLWLAVVRRFFSAFGIPAKVSTLTRTLTYQQDTAVVSGKTYDDLGWIELDNALCGLTGQETKAEAGILPSCDKRVPLLDARPHKGQTTAPKPFTEATLLSLMENIHTKFEDSEESLKEALGAKGIGTPATRASIIELLIHRGYITRQKKGSTNYLRATEDGMKLVSSLKAVRLEFLTQPQLTAEWESKITDMEKGEGEGREVFLEKLTSLINSSLETLHKNQSPDAPSLTPRSRAEGVPLETLCPFTQKPVLDHGTYWVVPQYPNAKLYKTIASKPISLDDYFSILRNSSPLFEGFTSQKGKQFKARVSFDPSLGKFSFVFDEGSGMMGSPTGKKCPLSGEEILDHAKFWVFGARPTKFWKVMAGRKMKLSEYSRLVKEGSTEFLEGFISKSGNKFTAALNLVEGEVKFSFGNSSGRSGPQNVGMKGPGAKSKKS
jgi:DNA topoisomerase-3